MSDFMLTILDYIEKSVENLNFMVSRENLEDIGIEIGRLKSFSECLKLQLPLNKVRVILRDFDGHLNYVEKFYKERNFDWIRRNLDEIKHKDIHKMKGEINELADSLEISKKDSSKPSSNVFVVHGRDHNPMKELKTMLCEFGLTPVVLHEQPSGGRTIVEKLEKYSDVGFAFVILTPDDRGGQFKGKLRFIGGNALDEVGFRARQNVILEFGYFIGKLGRNKVCCLQKGDVDFPSDMQGIVYIPFKESLSEVRHKIVNELEEANYEIKK